MKEAANEDYNAYETIGEFFSRPLKPGVRPVDDCSLVSINKHCDKDSFKLLMEILPINIK